MSRGCESGEARELQVSGSDYGQLAEGDRGHLIHQGTRKGARGAARPANRLNADRAEVFELALARVSARLGVVARAAAAELKAERLAAAREVKAGTGPGAVAPSSSAASVPSTKRRATKTTGGLKRDASSQSQGTRRQASKDAR